MMFLSSMVMLVNNLILLVMSCNHFFIVEARDTFAFSIAVLRIEVAFLMSAGGLYILWYEHESRAASLSEKC